MTNSDQRARIEGMVAQCEKNGIGARRFQVSDLRFLLDTVGELQKELAKHQPFARIEEPVTEPHHCSIRRCTELAVVKYVAADPKPHAGPRFACRSHVRASSGERRT